MHALLYCKYVNYVMNMSRIVEIERDSRPVNIRVGYLPTEDTTVHIKWAIYKKKHKFLWKTWYTFDYDLTVPYISEKSLSAAERESNIKLELASIEVRHSIYQRILSKKMQLN